MKEYKQTDDYKNLIVKITDYLDAKRDKFYHQGYEHYTFAQPPLVEYIMDAYDIPFFDKFTNLYYHKDGKLILNLPVCYYQLEFFMKALFIRIFWFNGRENKDKFAEFIWNEYCNANNMRFNILKDEAQRIYLECNTISEFYERFILNDCYYFIDYLDYLELMLETFNAFNYNIISSELVEFPVNSIDIFEHKQSTKTQRSKISYIDQLRLINSQYNKLNVDAKYSFVPKNKTQALKSFNFSLIIINDIFIPQLLVFPK